MNHKGNTSKEGKPAIGKGEKKEMNQDERRQFLIRTLLDERPDAEEVKIPGGRDQQKMLLRGLMNVREASPIREAFRRVQDEYLKEENARRGIVELSSLTPAEGDLYLWRGDITRLDCGAIVNAANSGMTGCYQPCHNCIDNCIHTYAGIQLRNYCAEIMRRQGYAEPPGQAKLTPAFNLPCRYVIHTVGPIVEGRLTARHEALLASCYRSCLDTAAENGIDSIAFCCISTGVFMFPNERAAEIAVRTVRQWKAEHKKSADSGEIKVIFNVFKEKDEQIYRRLLGADRAAETGT